MAQPAGSMESRVTFEAAITWRRRQLSLRNQETAGITVDPSVGTKWWERRTPCDGVCGLKGAPNDKYFQNNSSICGRTAKRKSFKWPSIWVIFVYLIH